MKTRIRFIDSYNKEFIKRKLKDACENIIEEYNTNDTIVAPILEVGVDNEMNWETKLNPKHTRTKEANLLEYVDEDGRLNFEKLFKEFLDFLYKDNEDIRVQGQKEIIIDTNINDNDEEIEDDPEDEDEEDEIIEEDEEEDEQVEETYEEYLKSELSEIPLSDFRNYLIKILLKQAKGWSYIMNPKEIKGDEYDIVTPKNAKKLVKSFREANK